MSISVWFHLYAAGSWRTPTQEFFDAAESSGLLEEGYVHLGIVGSSEQRREALDYCTGRGDVLAVAEAEVGAEQVTLNALWSVRDALEGAVLYAHGKGAAVVNEWNDMWRRSMYLCLVSEWRLCLPWLETVDTVGCHWVDLTNIPQQNPFWGGNCWLARASLIQRLEAPAMGTRYDAEAWIGTVRPSYHDMRPGFPSPETIRQEARGPNPPKVVLSADGMRWRTVEPSTT